MSIRLKQLPSELKKGVSAEMSTITSPFEKIFSKFDHKEDSFFISDKRLLRTIFDEPPKDETNCGTLSPSNSQEIQEKLEQLQNSPKFDGLEGNSPLGRRRSNSGNAREELPPKRERFRTHRRTSSETQDYVTPIHKSLSTPTELRNLGNSFRSHPKKVDIKLSHNGKDDLNALPSPETVSKSKAMKSYIEEYYWELLAYVQGRQKREKQLKKALQSECRNKFQQESLVREHLKHETAILRSRRLCGRLHDFTLIKKIGKGAYGEVFLVQKKNTKEYLALKKLSKANLHIKNQVAHVTTEKDVLKDADSSWLVHLIYTFQDSEYIYFAMDYIPGGDLRAYIENMGELPEDQARLYMAEMLLAVDALHQLGYIHRDLKPDNFLIDKDGHLKLADFGLSKKGVLESYKEPFKGQLPNVKLFAPSTLARKEAWKTRRSSVYRAKAYSLVGSPDYMAVEILRGAGYEWEADWWSLGCILFELLTSFPPFTGDTPHEVFSNVMNYNMVLENPEDDGKLLISERAWDLITKLICEPSVRLGKVSIIEIKAHQFFNELDWNHIRDIKPAFVPQLKSEIDTSYFASAQDVTPPPERTETSFLQKINSIPNLAFDDLTFSKAIFEREKGSGSDDDSPGRRSPSGTPVTISPRGSMEASGRKSPRPTLKSPRRTLSSKNLKKVSSFDKIGPLSKIQSRSNRELSSRKEENLIGEVVSLNYLSLHDWKVLCTGAKRIVFKKGSIVIEEGSYNTALYRIKSGVVRVEKNTVQGGIEKKVVLGKLEKNKVFGEMSFVEDTWKQGTSEEEGLGGNVSASVIVDSESAELYKIERSFIFSLFVADKEGLFTRFYQIIACMLADRVTNLPLSKQLVPIIEDTDEDKNSSTPSRPSSPRLTPTIEKKIEEKVRSNTTSPSRDPMERTLKRADAKFIKRFKLPQDEYLIKVYKCTLKKEEGAKSKKFHGRLYIGSNHLCYYSAVFGYIYKRAINFKDLVKLKKSKDPYQGIELIADGKKYIFYAFEKDLGSEAFKIIENIYESTKNPSNPGETKEIESESSDTSSGDEVKIRRRTSSVGTIPGPELIPGSEEALVAELSLSQQDWGLILDGSECVTYMKEQCILREGENFDSIYQIGNGIVRVEKRMEDGRVEILGTMGTSEMFGEVSFLEGVGATADIIADQNNVDIYIISKDYIEGLFKEHKKTGIEGKFYKFLSLVLSRRIRQKELEEQLKFSTSKNVFLTNME